MRDLFNVLSFKAATRPFRAMLARWAATVGRAARPQPLDGDDLWRWKLITRNDDSPYLWRLHLARLFDYRLMLHVFAASDDVCLHDHPRPFLSFILRGGYWETLRRNGTEPPVRRWHPAWSLLSRRAKDSHQIEIDVRRPAWTLVLMGRKERPWGFWTRFGWIHWREYSHTEHCA